MKKYFLALFFLMPLLQLRAQSSVEKWIDCLRHHPRIEQLTQPRVQEFQELQKRIYASVQELIRSEQVSVSGGVPVFENLESVTRVAQRLSELDDEYDDFFTRTASTIYAQFLSEKICSPEEGNELYYDAVTTYLEDEVFYPVDNYASDQFAQLTGFRSALQQVNQEVNQWLEQGGEELSGEDPALNQPLTEDHFWSVLNSNWDIELRNPEEALAQRLHKFGSEGSDGYSREAATDKEKLKEILQFIFDNWKDIKDILNWLNENVFYDCKASSSAKLKSTETLDAGLNSGVLRKVKYLVLQRGVLFDGRQTKTHLKGVVRIYKKKRIGWGKDRLTPMGVGYCTTQTNACENSYWPADGTVYFQAPNARNFKAYQNQMHPFALTIQDNSQQYLTYYLYFRQQLFKTIFLFGNGNCM